MLLIIAGSRNFNNPTNQEHTKIGLKAFEDLRRRCGEPEEIVSGRARGADLFGEWLAAQYNIRVAEFPADWNKYGKRGGYLRNAEMAEYATHLLAFWDGQSRGTKHMIDLAESKGLYVDICYF